MIEGKRDLLPKIRRFSGPWKSGETPFRPVQSLQSVHKVATPKDEVRPRIRTRKRPPNNEEIFSLLQDIQADIFDSTNNRSAGDPSDGATKRASSLSPLEELPLSPLMHPQLLKARRRYTEAKPLPSKDLTEFQTLLQKNTYAKILASPVRSCILTGVRLPCSLFLSFTIQNHPSTRKPWLMPKGLEYQAVPNAITDTPSSGASSPSPNSDDSSHVNLQPIDSVSTSPATPIRQIHAFTIPSPSPSALPSIRSTAYLTTQLPALARIAKLKPRSLCRILPFRWKTHFGVSLHTTVCREDLPDLVLSLLRKRLLQQLLALGDEEAPYLVPYSLNPGEGPHQLAAVLWMGTPQSVVQGEGRQEMAREGEPEACSMVQVRGEEKMVPAYAVRVLLGVGGLQELWDRSGGFDWRRQEAVGIKAKGRTVGLLWELWRLMTLLGGRAEGIRHWRKEEGRGVDRT